MCPPWEIESGMLLAYAGAAPGTCPASAKPAPGAARGIEVWGGSSALEVAMFRSEAPAGGARRVGPGRGSESIASVMN